jgi:amidase
VTDEISAFVPGVDVRIEGASEGPLAGLTFVAKDLFDVAGFPTGGGNPDWAQQNPLPSRHAWAVERLLDAGATLIGKTITDEVSLGILGENAFFGTPSNPADAQRVPGGSSSGSASAVAAGICDFALGTDTGGSVRVPASFCGLYGIRPTHGRLNLRGMLAQAPSSDTTGWLASDSRIFARVSEVMLGEPIPSKVTCAMGAELIVAVDAFGIADVAVRDALQPAVARLGELFATVREQTMAPPGLSVWARAQRTLQPYEAYQTFKEWIDRDNPRFAFSVARNLLAAESITAAERQWAALMRDDARARMHHLLREGAVLCLPSTPFPAPLKGLRLSEQTRVRDRITCLCSHGGLTGVCQISIPIAEVDGLPVGLSIVAAPGADAHLVAVANALASAGTIESLAHRPGQRSE